MDICNWLVVVARCSGGEAGLVVVLVSVEVEVVLQLWDGMGIGGWGGV